VKNQDSGNFDRRDLSTLEFDKYHRIDRVDIRDLTPLEFFDRYRKPGLPVILLGLVNEPDWSLDYLCKQLGDREFLCRFYGRDRQSIDKRQWDSIGSGIEVRPMLFSQYAELIRSGEAHRNDIYMAKCPIRDTPLASAKSLQSWGERLGFDRSASGLNFWIGPGGHVESLHYDTFDGTLAQLHGSKRLVLFPPSQLNNLYPFPLLKHLTCGLKLRSWFSQVYPDRPDFEAFPHLQEALKYRCEVILQPGEVLYIPAGWWHEVTALGNELVCSVNRFWRVSPPLRTLLQWSAWRTYLGIALSMPYMLSQLALASLKPNRKESIEKIMRMF